MSHTVPLQRTVCQGQCKEKAGFHPWNAEDWLHHNRKIRQWYRWNLLNINQQMLLTCRDTAKPGTSDWKGSQRPSDPTVFWKKHSLNKMAQHPIQLNLKSVQHFPSEIVPVDNWSLGGVSIYKVSWNLNLKEGKRSQLTQTHSKQYHHHPWTRPLHCFSNTRCGIFYLRNSVEKSSIKLFHCQVSL